MIGNRVLAPIVWFLEPIFELVEWGPEREERGLGLGLGSELVEWGPEREERGPEPGPEDCQSSASSSSPVER